ncbi:MAG: hypothetical protein KUG56_02965 [Kordiimonadaceae bacterium]|nr:hypothetical protein [Kordiimonadaceae bacterium]
MAITREKLLSKVEDAANEIHDPCALARGMNIGVTDMGMIRHITLKPETGSGLKDGDLWAVIMRIRLTAPACTYMPYFEKHIKQAVLAIPEVSDFFIEWDGNFDWTPENMSDSAKAMMAERQKRLEAELAKHPLGPVAV